MTDKGQHGMDDLHLLAPWYANGTLDAESRKAFEEALKSDAALRRALAGRGRHQHEAFVAVEEAAQRSAAGALELVVTSELAVFGSSFAAPPSPTT